VRGGSSGAGFRTFWCKKFGFFEINGVILARTRGVEPEQHFADKGGGGNISKFIVDVFYGQRLIELHGNKFFLDFLFSPKAIAKTHILSPNRAFNILSFFRT